MWAELCGCVKRRSTYHAYRFIGPVFQFDMAWCDLTRPSPHRALVGVTIRNRGAFTVVLSLSKGAGAETVTLKLGCTDEVQFLPR